MSLWDDIFNFKPKPRPTSQAEPTPPKLDGTYEFGLIIQELSFLQNSSDVDLKGLLDGLLAKYDMTAINSSTIKYIQAVRQWADELLDLMNKYYKAHASVFSNLTDRYSECVDDIYIRL